MNPKLIIVDSSVVVDAFDTNAAGHSDALAFLNAARANGFIVTMPMHGYFEVRCTLRRIVHIEGKKISPAFTSFETAYPIKTIAIDNKFLDNFEDVKVPYMKAGDTIFLVIAKKLGLPLVSRDKPMLEKARECGILALDVHQGLAHMAA